MDTGAIVPEMTVIWERRMARRVKMVMGKGKKARPNKGDKYVEIFKRIFIMNISA
jgi:hypothetical protein